MFSLNSEFLITLTSLFRKGAVKLLFDENSRPTKLTGEFVQLKLGKKGDGLFVSGVGMAKLSCLAGVSDSNNEPSWSCFQDSKPSM